ncbi:ATP-dependent DNA ligase, partial [Rhodococcus hoagii]|nr:ATP-dependent DNA ligase [Prescottella equi]
MSAAPTPPAPMLATLGEPPAGEGWAFEMKWDGQRAVTDVRDGGVRLFSRNGNDITTAFPE